MLLRTWTCNESQIKKFRVIEQKREERKKIQKLNWVVNTTLEKQPNHLCFFAFLRFDESTKKEKYIFIGIFLLFRSKAEQVNKKKKKKTTENPAHCKCYWTSHLGNDGHKVEAHLMYENLLRFTTHTYISTLAVWKHG